MRVIKVAPVSDVDKIVFLDATRVAVRTWAKGPYRELPSSLWDVLTGARVEPSLPGFATSKLGQFQSGEWFLGSVKNRSELIAHHPASGRTVVEVVEGPVCALALTPDGKTALYSWHDDASKTNGYGSRTWSGPGVFEKGFEIPFVEGAGHNITPLPDGERFVTLGRNWMNPHLSVRSVATGAILVTGGLAYLQQAVITVAPDGRQIVAAVVSHLYVFSPDDLKGKHVASNDGPKHFTGIAFHPSGKYLAATSNDETVKLYDTATWEVARTFIWNIGRMRSVAFSPDGALAAAGSDKGKVVVWDVDL